MDERCARIGSYYLGRRHELIHRHSESVQLDADQGAHWRLEIDFELPNDPAARCSRHDDEATFLFPLIFLRKAEGATGFRAQDESGRAIPLPNRATCDMVSAIAATQAAGRLRKESGRRLLGRPSLSSRDLRFVLERVTGWQPYGASVVLNQLLHGLDPSITEPWRDEGLRQDLEMLVEHSLIWVPLRGLPGEHRTIQICKDIELHSQPILRWNFGELKKPRASWMRPFLSKRLEDPRRVLDTGDAKYGLCARRISFSALGERVAQPLAWMPIEFDIPTIYTRRCDSYHFELTTPKGITPRGIKMAIDSDEEDPPDARGRTTIGARATHVYLAEARSVGEVVFRATVGISPNAFPIFWLLMGAITSIVLWGLAATDPTYLFNGPVPADTRNEVAAGVLLIVPALLGAVMVGTDDGPTTRLLSGARILLLAVGLCAAAAATVLVDIDPVSNHPRAVWTACATIATVATIPLATSWLLSLPLAWRWLRVLNSAARQYAAFLGLLLVGGMVVVALAGAEGDGVLRGALSVSLLLLSMLLILLASNRLAVTLDENRLYLPIGAMFAACGCVALACIELRAAIDSGANLHAEMEGMTLWVISLAPLAGLAVWLVTWLFRRPADQISISPDIGSMLIAGERIHELRQLRTMPSRQGHARRWRIPNPVGRVFREGG